MIRSRNPQIPISYAVIATLGVALVWLPFMVRAAHPHEATTIAGEPLGWTYSVSCCSQRDCAEVPAQFIRETPEGYRIDIPVGGHPMVTQAAYHDLIPYTDRRVKDSPDGRMHACISPPCTATKCQQRTYCLYRPQPGF